MAVTNDAKTLALLRSVPNGIEIRIVRRSDHSEDTVFLPVPVSRPEVAKLDFSPDGSRLVVVNGQRLWAISTRSDKILFEFAIPSEPDRFFGQISVSNASIAAEIRELKSHLNTFRDVLLLDSDGKQLESFTLAALDLESIYTLRLSPDGKLLAVLTRGSATQQSSVVMLDTAGALLWQSQISKSFDIQWTRDKKTLIVKDSRIEEFDAGTGKPIGHPTEELHWVDEFFYTNSTLEIDPALIT